jgi:hypothetical protein
LVTAINGTPLDDPQRGQEIFNTLQSSTSASVTIERGGQTMQVNMNIAQVASEANRELTAAPQVPAQAPRASAREPEEPVQNSEAGATPAESPGNEPNTPPTNPN